MSNSTGVNVAALYSIASFATLTTTGIFLATTATNPITAIAGLIFAAASFSCELGAFQAWDDSRSVCVDTFLDSLKRHTIDALFQKLSTVGT